MVGKNVNSNLIKWVLHYVLCVDSMTQVEVANECAIFWKEFNIFYFCSVTNQGVLKVLSITATTCRSLLLTSWATYKVAAIRGDQISLKVINILQLQQLHQYWKLYQKIAFPLTICMGSMGIYVCGPSWCPNYLPHRPKHLLKGFPCILTWCFPYLHSNLSWRFPLL